MDLNDKVILITGAAQGLGLQFAKDLAQAGARLALVDMNQERLDAAQAQITALGTKAKGYRVNVAQEDQVVALFEQVLADFGRLDGCVNNAGVLKDHLLVGNKDGQLTRLPLQVWQSVIDVNLTGVFLCGREAAYHLIQQKIPGVIVNIASVSRAGNVGQTNYAASKAGVQAMTVSWSKELAKYGIRVASIAPGFTSTEMLESLPPEIKERFTRHVPLGRFATTQEMSQALLFIFHNDYYTGRCLELDGGVRL